MLLVAPLRSYRVASYQRACERLGYRLLIVSDSPLALTGQGIQGLGVDFTDPERALRQVLDSIAGERVLCVIATDDRVVTLASHIADALGLPHNDPESALLTRRKDLARTRLKKAGCNTPEFHCLPLARLLERAPGLNYPVVIKPLMLSGSRGVMRADDPQQLIESGRVLEEILASEPGDSFEHSHCLIEAYLDGEEIAFDGFLQDGRLLPLALFDKPQALTGPCFEESCYITPSRLPGRLQREIIEEIERCCAAYGLRHGPIHAEARLTHRGVVLLEMASRSIGGQCGRSLEFVLGEPLEEVILRLSCGDAAGFERSPGHAGVMMIPIRQSGLLRRVEGMLEARKTPHVRDIEIHIQPGYELVPLPRGSSYLGFIFAQAADYDSTWQALRAANAKLRFVTRPGWKLEPT